VKLYGEPPSSPEAARRYSPSECVGTRKHTITGNPDPKLALYFVFYNFAPNASSTAPK
jgi:hypothetical protein